ncbi:hypothetical protein [Pseudomonas putida]|uniref:Uncharacterized protein n=1 Tax=Pseudomonas putida TaxID=303 RepID=A0A1X0ZMA2_PSEPU|nr:hypothetical protein [Pseudomonas putida]ORL58101.1 hypothetical protein B7H17_26250 [Pseudomonas putida]
MAKEVTHDEVLLIKCDGMHTMVCDHLGRPLPNQQSVRIESHPNAMTELVVRFSIDGKRIKLQEGKPNMPDPESVRALEILQGCAGCSKGQD